MLISSFKKDWKQSLKVLLGRTCFLAYVITPHCEVWCLKLCFRHMCKSSTPNKCCTQVCSLQGQKTQVRVPPLFIDSAPSLGPSAWFFSGSPSTQIGLWEIYMSCFIKLILFDLAEIRYWRPQKGGKKMKRCHACSNANYLVVSLLTEHEAWVI